MEINAYQPCPCHSERKIKFCCGKQIVGDLNEVMTLSSAGQAVAAVDKLDRLLQTWGDKDCLLTLRTHLLLSLGETAKARAGNDQFLAKNPKHPMGLLHQALICAEERDLPAAVRACQDAMDTIKGTAIPVAFANAFRVVGLNLLRQGAPYAGRAHLRFALTLRPNDDELKALLRESIRLPWESTIHKYDPAFPQVPGEPDWGKTYQQVRRLISRGQWRTAAQYIDRKMLPDHPQEPVLHRTLAVLAMMLNDRERAQTAWRAYAECPGVEQREQVEAYVWLMSLGGISIAARQIPIRAVTIPVRDPSRLLAALRNDPQITELSAGPEARATAAEVSRFALLDRPALRTAPAEITVDQLPLTRADITLQYPAEGSPALEISYPDQPNVRAEVDQLEQRLAAMLQPAERSEREGGSWSEDSACLTWRWQVPSGLSRETIRDFERAWATHQACTAWTQVPMVLLDGLTPQQAAERPELRARLLALIAQFETNSQLHPFDADTARAVRAHLGLPQPDLLDPRQVDPKLLSPIWWNWIDWSAVSDSDLLLMAPHAFHAQDRTLSSLVAHEIVRREHLESQIDMGRIYQVLAETERNDDAALEWVRRLRKIETMRGNSPAAGLMFELEWRVTRGIAEKTPELFEEITSRYLHLPQIAHRFRQLLNYMGLAPGAEANGASEDEDEPIGSAAGDALASSAAPSSDPGPGRKLWLPGDP